MPFILLSPTSKPIAPRHSLRKRTRKNGKRTTHYAINPHISTVTDAIKSYGQKNNIAVWDWYTISGGEGSCETWVKEKGMQKDHIHYTEQGYVLQGTLLYQSIMKAYEQHIQ